MDRETILTEARFLLARVGSDTPPAEAEIARARGRLSAMRMHPSCSPARAEQISSALLILDVLALGIAEASDALTG
jgi:hypothetical protein